MVEMASTEPCSCCNLSVYVIAALVAVVVYRTLFKSKDDNIPSVQGGLPFFGHVFTMLKGTPWGTMADWMLEYGGIYKFRLFGSDAIAISDPKLLAVVLNHKMSTFKKDLAWTYKPFLVILGNGLVTSDGADWRRQRRLLAHHLRFDILTVIPPMAWRAVKRLIVKLEKVKKEGGIVEMAEEFRHLTLQVVAEAMLSLSPEESDTTFAHMYMPIVEEGNLRTWHPERMYLPTPGWFKHRKDVATLNDYVTGLIEKRWALRQREAAAAAAARTEITENETKSAPSTGSPRRSSRASTIAKTAKSTAASADSAAPALTRTKDVLDEILAAVPAEDWGPAVVAQIRDEVKTFILAGHETSASMLAWSLYELSQDSQSHLRDRVVAEGAVAYDKYVDQEQLRTKGRVEYGELPVSQDDAVEHLQYTECCLRESLRLYSVVPSVTRTCSEEVELPCIAGKEGVSTSNTTATTTSKDKKYVIPRGTTIMVNIQGVHHNPEQWPEPKKYLPDRFLQPVAPYSFLPFAEGPRQCLGQFLSLLESKIVLSMLLYKFKFEVVNTEDAGKTHPYMVPIIPKTGHFCKVL